MGIKDKVLNILFDDEEEEGSKGTPVKRKQKEYDASSLLNTSPVFIDVNPSNHNNDNISNTHSTDSIPSSYIKEEINEINDTSEYTYTANISPIFGVVDKKTKSKNKGGSKVKTFSGVGEKKTNPGSTTQQNVYTDIILSPIFGPMSTKDSKKVSKSRKKETDEFERNIDDTGSFEVEYEETQDETPSFEDVVEDEEIEEVETIGDTDRLERISDRINQIKNEAATIYSGEDEQDAEEIIEEENSIPVDNSISNLIHNFQLKDYDITPISTPKPSHQEPIETEPVHEEPVQEEVVESTIVYDEPVEEAYSEPIEEIQESTYDNSENTSSIPSFEAPIEEPTINDTTQFAGETEPIYKQQSNTNPTTSIDDLFQDEDNGEGKDLFSELFGED